MTYDGHTGVDPDECVVPTVNGQAVVFPSYAKNEAGCDYIRFINLKDQGEMLYYTKDEWAEEPELVMGCIMGAIQSGADNLKR